MSESGTEGKSLCSPSGNLGVATSEIQILRLPLSILLKGRNTNWTRTKLSRLNQRHPGQRAQEKSQRTRRKNSFNPKLLPHLLRANQSPRVLLQRRPPRLRITQQTRPLARLLLSCLSINLLIIILPFLLLSLQPHLISILHFPHTTRTSTHPTVLSPLQGSHCQGSLLTVPQDSPHLQGCSLPQGCFLPQASLLLQGCLLSLQRPGTLSSLDRVWTTC